MLMGSRGARIPRFLLMSPLLLLLRLLLHQWNLVVSPLLHLMPLVLFSLDH